jgi:predicted TIM-barrel fold metal-dependent hydrolase
MGLSVNFHIAAGDNSSFLSAPHGSIGVHAKFASAGAAIFVNNVKSLTDVIFSGICHRHPSLDFVSVESGIGWIPFALAAMDWQWINAGVHVEHPEYELLPSEYFHRQFYGCFWFEGQTALDTLEILGADNFMFETDFPHPTSLSPGPKTIALPAKEHLKAHFSDLAPDVLRKILRENAARVYHLDIGV